MDDKKTKHKNLSDSDLSGSSNMSNMQCNTIDAELDGSSKYSNGGLDHIHENSEDRGGEGFHENAIKRLLVNKPILPRDVSPHP